MQFMHRFAHAHSHMHKHACPLAHMHIYTYCTHCSDTCTHMHAHITPLLTVWVGSWPRASPEHLLGEVEIGLVNRTLSHEPLRKGWRVGRSKNLKLRFPLSSQHTPKGFWFSTFVKPSVLHIDCLYGALLSRDLTQGNLPENSLPNPGFFPTSPRRARRECISGAILTVKSRGVMVRQRHACF